MGDDASQKKPASDARDVVLIHGVTQDGKGFEVLRARKEGLEIGQVRPLEQGKPLQGEVVKLRPRPGVPFICDVETEFVPPTAARAARPSDSEARAAQARHAEALATEASRRARKGPAQVASRAYRQNWDAIWSTDRNKKDRVLN